MSLAKKNCWEYKKCGRETGGEHVTELGICPAAEEGRLDGIHSGKNAGRSCWIVAGTLCQGNVQGSFAQKYQSCEQCDFYRIVKEEEFPRFELSVLLLKKISANK
ncbi:MAG: hypothetical protein WA610_01015 [Thermodesulfovibrionales bacterium]